MYSFPKLRKTFAAASVTFNMEQSFHDACACKMLSIVQMATQCPLQTAFYSMLYRYHRHRAENVPINTNRRKYEWWEFKMVKMTEDNDLEPTFDAVHEHLRSKIEHWTHCEHKRDMLQALSVEMQVDKDAVIGLMDAFENE